MKAHALLLLAVLPLSCRPPTGADGPGDTTAADAGTDVVDAGVTPDAGVVDAGPTCPALSHAEDDGCVTAIDWAPLANIPSARDHHGTGLVSAGAKTLLVVVNGVDMGRGLAIWDTRWAETLGDGTIAPWVEGPRPPFWAAGSGIATQDNRMYVISGQDGVQKRNVPGVQVLEADDDGTLGWREDAPLPGDGSFHLSATIVGRWLFAIGGSSITGKAMANVWVTAIGADGTLAPWAEARALPEPRSHHVSFTAGGRLYVQGGLDAEDFNHQQPGYEDALIATVDPDTGALGEWQRQALPFTRTAHSAVVESDSVILLGGFDADVNLVADVLRAPLLEDGTLGAFEALPPLPLARGHVHQTPMKDGRIYTVGGNVGNHAAQARVFVGTLY